MQNLHPHSKEDARFHILSEVIQQITSILDINELLTEVVRLIQKTFDYYHVGIGLIEGEYVIYRVGAGSLWDDPNFEFKPSRLKIGREGVTGLVAKTGEPTLVRDVSREPRYVSMQGSLTRSEVLVPIQANGCVTGVLDIQSQQEHDLPGARNRFFRDNLGPDGRFKPAEQLRAEFEALLGDIPASAVVHSCGSGVSACHNLLAMEVAGLPGSRLYPGSWSEWCADPARPVATD